MGPDLEKSAWSELRLPIGPICYCRFARALLKSLVILDSGAHAVKYQQASVTVSAVVTDQLPVPDLGQGRRVMLVNWGLSDGTA